MNIVSELVKCSRIAGHTRLQRVLFFIFTILVCPYVVLKSEWEGMKYRLSPNGRRDKKYFKDVLGGKQKFETEETQVSDEN